MPPVKRDEAERLAAWERREHDAATGRNRRVTENTIPQSLTPTRVSDEPRRLCIEGALAWAYCNQLETVTRYRTHSDAAEIDAAVERLAAAAPLSAALVRRYGRIGSRPDGWVAEDARYEPRWKDGRPELNDRGQPKRGSFVLLAQTYPTKRGRACIAPFAPVRIVGGLTAYIREMRAEYACWWEGVGYVFQQTAGNLQSIEITHFDAPQFPWERLES